MSISKRIAPIVVLVVGLGAAGGQFRAVAEETSQQPSAAATVHHYFSKVEHKHDVEWGYSGARGPEHWGALSEKFKIARDGKQQSPIDLRLKDAASKSLPPLRFDYRKERISAINNGHTIQHNEAPGSFLHIGSQSFALEQFHLHAPSEHTIDGKHFEMEIHFVHKSTDGKVAVVAVLMNVGAKDAVNVPRYKEIPQLPGERIEADDAYRNVLDLLPKDRRYLTYRGSFTTPPCTEGVRWIVMTSPVQVMPDAVAEFKRTIGPNNRPLQSINGRRVLVDMARDGGN
jgi:carbonic anhydrase